MALHAPESMALVLKLEQTLQRIDDLRQLSALAEKCHLAQKFNELPDYLISLLSQAESERQELLSALSPPKRETHYEVSVADAALALGVSENTIRNWDTEGCPDDATYPGRFHAIVFYQWAVSFKSKKNFARQAKLRAIHQNNL